MGDEKSKDDLGGNLEYPSLRVITSSEKDQEDQSLADTPKFFKTGHSQNFDTSDTVEELGLRRIIGGIGFGSLSRIRVHSNDSSLGSAPNSRGGFGSLISSPHFFEEQNSNEDVSILVPSTNHSPRSSYDDYDDDDDSDHYSTDAIDTKAPIESVKDAVSKFGGIVDWKAHKDQTVEKRKIIKTELHKAQEEIQMCKKECADAEEDRFQVMKELEMSKDHIEELKFNLEKTQTEEQQAKQDFEQAKLRLEEYEEGIDHGTSISAEAQLDIAKTRHTAAVEELKIVQGELTKMKGEFSVLASDRDTAIKKAEEASTTAKELEKIIEDLAVELTTTKGALESARAEQLEGEKIRATKAVEINQEMVNMEKGLKEAEEDLQRLDKGTSTTKDLRSKIDVATALLQRLKVELASYMDSKLNQENNDDKQGKPVNKSQNNLHAAITSAKKELVLVKASIEYTRNEVTCLKVLASSFHSEGVASLDVALLEAEWNAIRSQVRKTMEEAAQANVVARATESRLLEAEKEIEAAKHLKNNEILPNGVTLSMEEFLKLKKQVQENESEANNLQILEETNREIVQRKEKLQTALRRAEIAKKGKLEAEEKWRNMRAEHEQRQRKAAMQGSVKTPMQGSVQGPMQGSAQMAMQGSAQAPIQVQQHTQAEIEQNYKDILSLETAKKKKKFAIPKFFMFMGKKKASS